MQFIGLAVKTFPKPIIMWDRIIIKAPHDFTLTKECQTINTGISIVGDLVVARPTGLNVAPVSEMKFRIAEPYQKTITPHTVSTTPEIEVMISATDDPLIVCRGDPLIVGYFSEPSPEEQIKLLIERRFLADDY